MDDRRLHLAELLDFRPEEGSIGQATFASSSTRRRSAEYPQPVLAGRVPAIAPIVRVCAGFLAPVMVGTLRW